MFSVKPLVNVEIKVDPTKGVYGVKTLGHEAVATDCLHSALEDMFVYLQAQKENILSAIQQIEGAIEDTCSEVFEIAQTDGRGDFFGGIPITNNPYLDCTDSSREYQRTLIIQWEMGWKQAQRQKIFDEGVRSYGVSGICPYTDDEAKAKAWWEGFNAEKLRQIN